MSANGWIKLHRQLQDNPLWFCEKFTRGQAWVDLLLLTNHEDSFFYKRGVKIDVMRGQCARSEVELADRWKWSRTKVRKFLKDLEKEQQIIQQKTNITQKVTIVNFDEYQKKEQQTGQQKNSRRTAEEQQKNTYKNVKNVKNDKEVIKDMPKKSTNGLNFNPMLNKPSFLSEKDLQDIIVHRAKHKSKPVKTERSFAGIYNQLKKAMSKGYSVEQCLEKWFTRGWASFDADWMENGNAVNGKKQTPKTFAQMKDENMRNAMKEFVEEN